jgi:peptide/nickel transport system permease protein
VRPPEASQAAGVTGSRRVPRSSHIEEVGTLAQEAMTLQDTPPVDEDTIESASRRATSATTARLLRYTAFRLVALFFTVVAGVYLTILVANMGGRVDDIRRAQIREVIDMRFAEDPALRQLTTEERTDFINQEVALAEKRVGLDQPFVVRSFRYLSDALTLNLGFAEQLASDSGSKQVRLVITERLPSTLVLFGTSNLLLFVVAIYLALSLSRRYGSRLDKATMALAPTSAAPGWFYGLFLILVFAGVLGVLPFGGMVDAPPPEDPLTYALSLLKHMILPVVASLIGSIFLSIYNWRTFFLIFSSEDYVEMAKAKGLPDQMIERRYVLRPTLPNIITSFALTLISLWMGAIILETVFNWPGVGRLYFRAIGLYDTPVIVAITVVYAYLLAVTVFLLDFMYALVDPRVRVGQGGTGR